jgi:hypothetical protein
MRLKVLEINSAIANKANSKNRCFYLFFILQLFTLQSKTTLRFYATILRIGNG